MKYYSIKNKLNYSFLINILFILFLILLIHNSGSSEVEIIQQVINFQEENGKIPIVEINGVFTPLNQSIVNVPTNSKFNEVYNNRDISIIYYSIEINHLIYLHFVNELTWDVINTEPNVDVYTINYNLNITDPFELDLPFSNNSIDLKPSRIKPINNIPGVIGGFSPGYAEDLLFMIMELSILEDITIDEEHEFFIRDYYYFNDTFLGNDNSINELCDKTDQIIDIGILQLSSLNEFNVGLKSTPFINLVYSLEERNYNTLNELLLSSSAIIIFIELIILLGYKRNLFNKTNIIILKYFRGMSFEKLKNNLITKELKITGSIILITVPTLFFLKWTTFQISLLSLIAIPWILLYLLFTILIITNQFRNTKHQIITNAVPKESKFIITHKILGPISLGLLTIAIFSMIKYKFSFFGSYTLIYFYWLFIFLILYFSYFVLDKDLLSDKINKFSSGNLLYRIIRKNMNYIVLILIIISFNTYLNQGNSYTINNYDNNAAIVGSMSDFSSWDQRLINVNITNFNQIESIQSYLPIYSSAIYLLDENSVFASDSFGFGVKLVNQSQYSSFAIKEKYNINQENFFKDKLWIPKNYFSSVAYSVDKQLYIGNKPYLIDQSDIELLNEKTGIIESGNTIVASLETWQQLNLPMDDLSIERVLISFIDNIDVDTAKERIGKALNLDSNTIQLNINKDRVVSNSLEETVNTSYIFNLFFSLGIGLLLFYLLIDEEIQKTLLYYLTNYGVKKSEKMLFQIIMFSSIITIISVILGSFTFYLGTSSAIRYQYIFNFDFSSITSLIISNVVPQMLIQLLLSLRLLKDFNKEI